MGADPKGRGLKGAGLAASPAASVWGAGRVFFQPTRLVGGLRVWSSSVPRARPGSVASSSSRRPGPPPSWRPSRPYKSGAGSSARATGT